MGRRRALLIGNSEYKDRNLAKLSAPGHDVSALAKALQDKEIGRYDVDLLVNESFTEIRRKISRLFAKAGPKDLLLLYFSGHGVRDDMGRLYLATKESELDDLQAMSIEADFITRSMDQSLSKRQILILDCCHAGAVVKGTKSAVGGSVGTSDQFCGKGQGRIILAACDAFQYAWDGQEMHENEAAGNGAPSSMFTKHLINGLVTGEADKDGNGVITVDEVADYVSRKVVEETPKQRPRKFVFEANGHIVFAVNKKAKQEGFRKLRKRCFVISPLSGAGNRHDEVLKTYIEPACEKASYTAVRSDMQLSQTILPELMGSLRSDPMVIAYLGRPPWNPNVMIEVGFRLASGRPLVLLREPVKSDGRGEQPLPFDLHNHRVIFLPDAEELEQGSDIVAKKIEQIAKLMRERGMRNSVWETPHARAKVRIDQEKKSGVFFSASPMADDLFNCPEGLADKPLGEIVESLQRLMTRSQFDKFTEEQGRLVGEILGGGIFRSGRSKKKPYATRPIVFAKHPVDESFVHRAYLPVITRYSSQGSELWLDIVYLDVTNAIEKDPEDADAVVCDLVGAQASRRAEVVIEDPLPEEPPPTVTSETDERPWTM